MGKKISRANQLIEIIKAQNGATVKDLAAITGVSEMTIRRDLKLLNENGIVKNVYGSTIYNPGNHIDKLYDSYQLENAVSANNAEKERIGAFAATFVSDGEVIIIDTGSTTQSLATHLNCSFALQVLCYNTNILNCLLYKKNVSLLFAGGRYHPDTQLFESAEGIELIKNTRANKAFISAAGIHQNLGVTCINGYEVAAKQAIIRSAAQRILLVDSSKFTVVKAAYFADLATFHTIITDTGISLQWQEILQNAGIKLYMV